MGVYLPNMEMPKPGEVIRIYNNSEARRCRVTEQEAFEVGIAFPVPEPHGRLIDADALEAKVNHHYKHKEITRYDRDLLLHYLDVEMSPTIIQASEEG